MTYISSHPFSSHRNVYRILHMFVSSLVNVYRLLAPAPPVCVSLTGSQHTQSCRVCLAPHARPLSRADRGSYPQPATRIFRMPHRTGDSSIPYRQGGLHSYYRHSASSIPSTPMNKSMRQAYRIARLSTDVLSTNSSIFRWKSFHCQFAASRTTSIANS